MAGGARNALIVASSDYADPELRRLQAPASDAQALGAVLRDPAIGGFEVRTLLDRPTHEVALAVEDFFADRQPDDLLLVHFSCHGIKDEDGELYFAMADTLLRRLAATAVAANFVNQRMTRSRSKRVVLLLDCCYAGAFERGMTARVGGGVGIEAQLGGGRGRAVITASDAMQYAYEGGELAAAGEPTPSVFTSALVGGLETGEADRDQDGKIALDELYDYIYEKVREATPNQTPCKWTYDIRGDLFIARRSRPVSTPAPLPGKLQEALDNPFSEVRAAAVRELDHLLHGRHEGLALAARLALQQLTDDDSRTVSAAAAAALATGESPEVPPRLKPSATSVGFGPLTQHSQSPEHSIRLANTGVSEISEPAEAAPTVDRSARPGACQVAASEGDHPIPMQATPASETAPLTAPRGRSGAAMLDAGFIILTAAQILIALTAFISQLFFSFWPWWVIFIACIIGITVTLGGVRQQTVHAGILLWVMGWSLIYSISVTEIRSSSLTTVLRIECIIGAVASVAFCIWLVVLLSKRIRKADPFLGVFLGLFSVALVLAAIAEGTGRGRLWYAVGVVTLAAALVLLLVPIRAHRHAAAPGSRST
jgi:hypothetical protein